MNTVVKTRYGEVRGSVADGVHTFKGIPYAAPPFGANRLRPPQPVVSWSDVRDALTFGPTPPQLPSPPPVDVLLPNPAVAHLASTWFHKLEGRRGLDWGVCGRSWPRLGA
jgi:hypothetical protein